MATQEIQWIEKTPQNCYSLAEAQKLNREFEKPVYCAVNEDGQIFDLSIGEPFYTHGGWFLVNSCYNTPAYKAKVKKARETEANNQVKYNYLQTGNTFTFDFEGVTYEGIVSKIRGSLTTYKRLPALGIKAETFTALLKKI